MLGSLSGSHEEEADHEEGNLIITTDQFYHRHHSYHHDHQQHGDDDHPPPPLLLNTTSTPVVHMRRLLIRCAELVSQSDFPAAHRLVTLLSTTSSPYGDSTDRLVHQFSRALSLRINRHIRNTPQQLFMNINISNSDQDNIDQQQQQQDFVNSAAASRSTTTCCSGGNIDHHQQQQQQLMMIPPAASSAASTVATLTFGDPTAELIMNNKQLQLQVNIDDLQSSYLFLNQITPFIRFSHLTANQAILEAIEGQQAIHILDFDTMHGVQWPPLMQAIAERSDPSEPPMIRITGTGQNLDTLLKTGDRLQKFAQSLGLRFQFHPLLLKDEVLISDIIINNQHDLYPCSNCSCSCSSYVAPSSSSNSSTLNHHHHHDYIHHDQQTAVAAAGGLQLHPSSPLISKLAIFPDETLAVNCVLYLHKLVRDENENDDDGDNILRLFLNTIKAMKPKVVTVAEREGNHNHPVFLRRFVEALDHYTAVFDSLEATLPPNSRERLSVEQVWFGREIVDIVSAEGSERRERHEKLESWGKKLNSLGFNKIPLSPFALSQAKLLLRLHYPSEGYQLQMLNDSFFLGWQNQPLFTVSSWY